MIVHIPTLQICAQVKELLASVISKKYTDFWVFLHTSPPTKKKKSQVFRPKYPFKMRTNRKNFTWQVLGRKESSHMALEKSQCETRTVTEEGEEMCASPVN